MMYVLAVIAGWVWGYTFAERANNRKQNMAHPPTDKTESKLSRVTVWKKQ